MAAVQEAPANDVSAPALWLIRITPSPGANGGRFANAIELTARASRPASLQHHGAELRRVLARPRADEPDPVRVAETLGGRGRERLGEDGLELLGLGRDLSFERRGVGQR